MTTAYTARNSIRSEIFSTISCFPYYFLGSSRDLRGSTKGRLSVQVLGHPFLANRSSAGGGIVCSFPTKLILPCHHVKVFLLLVFLSSFFYVLKFDIKSCARLFRLRSITSPFLPVGLGINDAMVVELGEEIPSFGWAGRTWSGGGEIRKLLLNSPLRPRAEADGNHSFWLDTLQGL